MNDDSPLPAAPDGSDDDSDMQTRPDSQEDQEVLLGDEDDNDSVSELREQNEVFLHEQGVDPDELTDEEREEILQDFEDDAGDDDSLGLSDVTPSEEHDGSD